MKIIVLDLEMNQPSNKIIEIGAVLVDVKLKKILSEFSELCNPGELPSLEYKLGGGINITELTGITPEMVSSADEASVVHDRFWRWVDACQCGGMLAGWGGDVWELAGQSKAMGVSLSSKIRSHDLKAFASFFRLAKGGKQRGGLANTLTMFDLPFEGVAHRALIDAKNTAILLLHLFEKLEKFFAIEKIMSAGDSPVSVKKSK